MVLDPVHEVKTEIPFVRNITIFNCFIFLPPETGRYFKKTVCEVYGCCRQMRREDIVLARARMGHTYFTYIFFYSMGSRPYSALHASAV